MVICIPQFKCERASSTDAHPSTVASSLPWTSRRRSHRILHRTRSGFLLPLVLIEYYTRGRWITGSLSLSLPLTPLDSVLQCAQVLPLPLLDNLRRRDVDGAFAPCDRREPVLHDNAGDRQVVVGGVGDRPVAELAVVTTFFYFAGPAFDEALGSLEWLAIMLRAILGHGALGTPASGRWEKNGALRSSCVTSF
jgi:hypothetical protein